MFNRPSYCPDAIATDTGWVNPRTGELLVAIRHLDSKIRHLSVSNIEQVRELDAKIDVVQPFTEQLSIDEERDTIKNHILSIDEPLAVEEQIPSTPARRGRPKKVV